MSDQRARQLRRAGHPLPDALVDPHPLRLDPTSPGAEAVVAAHREAVDDGADGYADPMTGLFSFTAAYHWDKGECCELGCRHCPWIDADARMDAADQRPEGDQ